MKRTLQRQIGKERHGTLLLAVLACLTLCAMLLTFWLRLIAMERRQVRSYQSALQAELLVDAALARAKVRADTDPTYVGETWQPTADTLVSPRATITVVPAGEGAESRELTVAAELGTGSKQFVRRTRKLSIPLSASPTPPPATPNQTPAEEPAP